MSLRYALLALLTTEPLTGYEAYKRFEGSVGHVWHAPDSQIYPELRRMEADGLLSSSEVPWGTKGRKKKYTVTEAGVEAFRSWLGTELLYSRERDPVRLKTAYMEWGDRGAIERQLRAHIEFHRRQVEEWEDEITQLRNRTSPALSARLATRPESEWKRIIGYKVLAYEGLISRGRAEISWAEHGLRTVARLEDGADAEAGDTPGHYLPR